MSKYLTAIIVTDPQPVTGNKFLKYRNIPKDPARKKSFLKFAAKFPGAHYINLYDAETKQFQERIYFK